MGKYRTIVADPPWPIRWDGGAYGGRRNRRDRPLPYGTMTVAAIAALPIADLAAAEAHLYLWVTPELHRRGVGCEVAGAWGFEVVNEIIWHKPKFGMGHFPRNGHEPLLVCRKGNLPFTAGRGVHSVQRWPNGEHSAKPDAALDLIESASPEPRVELFARRARFGWDSWGDESLGTAEMPEQAA